MRRQCAVLAQLGPPELVAHHDASSANGNIVTHLMRRVGVYVLSAAAAVAVGTGIPLAVVWRACRRPASEGCVWGRALLPVNVTATCLIVGLPTFFLVRRLLRGPAV